MSSKSKTTLAVTKSDQSEIIGVIFNKNQPKWFILTIKIPFYGIEQRKNNKISKFRLFICQIQILLFIFVIELPNIKVVMAPYLFFLLRNVKNPH
jgi:hypothetical protein